MKTVPRWELSGNHPLFRKLREPLGNFEPKDESRVGVHRSKDVPHSRQLECPDRITLCREGRGKETNFQKTEHNLNSCFRDKQKKRKLPIKFKIRDYSVTYDIEHSM